MKKVYLVAAAFLCLLAGTASAQYKTLLNFNGINGESPIFTKLIVSGSTIYGIAAYGGVYSEGCIFSMDTNGGNYLDLHDFDVTDGFLPGGAMILKGNMLYGTAVLGGPVHDSGTVFSIHTDGSGFKTLFAFNGITGYQPLSLMLSGSTLYGMTYLGGVNNLGLIYSIDTAGNNYTDLHDFDGTKGSYPVCQLTLLGSTLFGYASSGGANDSGVVFSMHTDGSRFKDLLDFTGPNGNLPYGGSFALSGNLLFGTTSGGGAHHYGCIYSVDTDGTGYSDLRDFGGLDGSFPRSSVVLSGSLLVGVASTGGVHDSGCLFSMLTDGGSYRDLYDFNNASGYGPLVNPVTISGNIIYGALTYGGADGGGVIYSFTYPTLGVGNIATDAAHISVYPNPSNGTFNIIVNSKLSVVNEMHVEVYNILGAQVYSTSLSINNSPFTINLANQPNGVYLYKVTSETGSLIGQGKLVIQK